VGTTCLSDLRLNEIIEGARPDAVVKSTAKARSNPAFQASSSELANPPHRQLSEKGSSNVRRRQQGTGTGEVEGGPPAEKRESPVTSAPTTTTTAPAATTTPAASNSTSGLPEGFDPSLPDCPSENLDLIYPGFTSSDFPPSFDWRHLNCVTPVSGIRERAQGTTPSGKGPSFCRASLPFAIAAAMEGAICALTGKLPTLSPQQLISCDTEASCMSIKESTAWQCNGGCEMGGTSADQALTYIKNVSKLPGLCMHVSRCLYRMQYTCRLVAYALVRSSPMPRRLAAAPSPSCPTGRARSLTRRQSAHT
jgi:hypothetical protein